jgi:short-subunit dehydrogenase
MAEKQGKGIWEGKTAVVTGASSGIGAATALRLAREGMQLVLVARREERLQDLANEIKAAGGEALPMAADLSHEEERLRLYAQIAQRFENTDVLVNNAGFGWYGYFAEMPWSTAMEMMQVNNAAVAHLTSLFLPGMRARNAGHIVNVGSIAGGLPSQGVALYSATKSFLDAFTTALHREMGGTKVRVSIVRPGAVASGFFDAAAKRRARLPGAIERAGISAGRVAERIWGLLNRPRRVVYVPWEMWISPWLELSFGWLMDLLGPLLLRRAEGKARP